MKTIILKKGDVAIVAESWKPIRERPVLAIRYGNESIKFASFNSELAAEMFMNLLSQFVGAEENA